MKSDNAGRLNDGRKESRADAGAGAGVGLSHAIRRGHDRRERAQSSLRYRLTRRPAAGAVSEIAWRMLELALVAVCVGCIVFLLTVAYVLLS